MLESLAFEAESSRSLPPLSSFFRVSAASIDLRCIPGRRRINGGGWLDGSSRTEEIYGYVTVRYGQHSYVKMCVEYSTCSVWGLVDDLEFMALVSAYYNIIAP